jgi:hypothetical protein
MSPINSQGVASFERIRTFDLVGVGVALLKEVCHLRWALRFQKLKPGPVALFLAVACQSGCRTLSYLFSPISTCMRLCFKPSDELNPQTVSQPQLSVLLYLPLSWYFFTAIKP